MPLGELAPALAQALQRGAGRQLHGELSPVDGRNDRLAKDDAFQNRQIRDTVENNIDTLLVRMTQRGWFAKQRDDGSDKTGDYDINPPFDVGFSAKATVEDPKVIRFEGTWNVLPVGTRIRVVLRDADYPNAKPAGSKP